MYLNAVLDITLWDEMANFLQDTANFIAIYVTRQVRRAAIIDEFFYKVIVSPYLLVLIYI